MAWDYNEWYRRKGKRVLSERRKKRYQNSPAYRETQRKRAREYYQRTRSATDVKDRTTVIARSGERYHTIGRVSKMINRNPQQIRDYHASGMLPDPLFTDTRGWRLYTAEQIMLMRRIFKQLDLNKLTPTEASRMIHDEWKERLNAA